MSASQQSDKAYNKARKKKRIVAIKIIEIEDREKASPQLLKSMAQSLVSQKKKKKRLEQDFSTITCYDYDKKGHYANTYPDQPKN